MLQFTTDMENKLDLLLHFKSLPSTKGSMHAEV